MESHGHRQRLRERFSDGYGIGMQDYEILELLLTYAIPRRDVKPIAKNLISRFGSLNGVLDAGEFRSNEDRRTTARSLHGYFPEYAKRID